MWETEKVSFENASVVSHCLASYKNQPTHNQQMLFQKYAVDDFYAAWVHFPNRGLQFRF